jgi:hypothetical protein
LNNKKAGIKPAATFFPYESAVFHLYFGTTLKGVGGINPATAFVG